MSKVTLIVLGMLTLQVTVTWALACRWIFKGVSIHKSTFGKVFIDPKWKAKYKFRMDCFKNSAWM